MTDEQRIRPFYCGTQADDWEDVNCRRCVKGYDEVTQTFRCDIQEAVFVAGWEDGTVSPSIAARMGHERAEVPPRYCWPCAEVAWSAAWQAHCRAMHPERFAMEAGL
jgi:hypothetical protein